MPYRFKPKRLPLADDALDARIRHVEDFLTSLGGSGVNPNTLTNAGSFGQNAAAAAGQTVVTTGGGGGGSAPILSGDVTGPAVNNTVSKLQGNTLAITSPVDGDLVVFSGSSSKFINSQSLKGAYTVTAETDASVPVAVSANSLTQTADLFTASTATPTLVFRIQASGTVNTTAIIDSGSLSCKGFTENNVTKTANYTATANDDSILADATGGAITITLPASTAGKTFVIFKKDGSANVVTIATTGGQTINGVATQMLAAQFQTQTLLGDGSNWFIVSRL